jgi:predicted RNA-binding Zn-ribbon protein involved in translation (DUF1610 family)
MRTRTSIVIIVLCVAGGIYLFHNHLTHREISQQELKKKLASYFYCESCGHEFLADGGVASTPCPECGKETSIIRLRKHCEDCGHEFVAYEHDIRTNQQRYSGGEWRPSINIDTPCPECGSRKLTSIPE